MGFAVFGSRGRGRLSGLRGKSASQCNTNILAHNALDGRLDGLQIDLKRRHIVGRRTDLDAPVLAGQCRMLHRISREVVAALSKRPDKRLL